MVQTKYMGMFKWMERGFTFFVTYVFYLVVMWLKLCGPQIPFIPHRAASYNILNYPLIACLMWVWKSHFTQVRSVDVHLVAKFGDGLEVKFVHTPHTADFPATHLLFIVSGVHHGNTLPDVELHTHSIQIWINLTLCLSV